MAAAAVTATAMATARVRATSMATLMEMPTATSMAIAAAEIDVAAAIEKLVAKAGGKYKKIRTGCPPIWHKLRNDHWRSKLF